jgi:hypothetical protein
MAGPSDSNRSELRGVVLSSDFPGGKQKSQNLRVGLRGPAGQHVQQHKDQQSSKQAVEQVEGGGAKTHGEEEEFSLGPKDRQWPG